MILSSSEGLRPLKRGSKEQGYRAFLGPCSSRAKVAAQRQCGRTGRLALRLLVYTTKIGNRWVGFQGDVGGGARVRGRAIEAVVSCTEKVGHTSSGCCSGKPGDMSASTMELGEAQNGGDEAPATTERDAPTCSLGQPREGGQAPRGGGGDRHRHWRGEFSGDRGVVVHSHLAGASRVEKPSAWRAGTGLHNVLFARSSIGGGTCALTLCVTGVKRPLFERVGYMLEGHLERRVRVERLSGRIGVARR